MSERQSLLLSRLGRAAQRMPTHARQWLRSRSDLILVEAGRGPAVPPSATVDVKRADQQNLTDLGHFQSRRQLSVFSGFLDAGNEGYLGYVEGVCVHRSWLVVGPAVVHGHWASEIRLGPSEGFVHYCETAPSARGSGVFPAVLSAIAADHPHLQLRMAIAAENTASLRAAQKAGWLPLERTTVIIRLGRTNVSRVSPDPG